MAAQRLNARSVRRIARGTGFTAVRAWSHGGYVMEFVTSDHVHGWWSKRDGSWGVHDRPLHYTSCCEMFPEWKGDPR